MKEMTLPGNANKEILNVMFRDGTTLTMEADAGHFVTASWSGAFLVLQKGNTMISFPCDLIGRVDSQEVE